MTTETDGYECYHCKQWIATGDAHDCWTTTEAALTSELSEDLKDAWERLRETAADFGEQRIYASHHSIMFSRKSCYVFVRPKRKFLEVCVFLDRPVHDPRVRRVERPSRTKVANVIRIAHRDEVEAPFTDWLREAYDLFDRPPQPRRAPPAPKGPVFASPASARRSNLAKKASGARKGGARKSSARKSSGRKTSSSRKSSSRKTVSRKTTSRKTTSRKTGARKSSAKRSAVKNRAGSFYAKRKSGGEFREMDEKGRSLKTDRRRRAKKTTKSGYGDQGDRRASSRKKR